MVSAAMLSIYLVYSFTMIFVEREEMMLRGILKHAQGHTEKIWNRQGLDRV